MHLRWLRHSLAICRLEPDEPLPAWVPQFTGFVAITRTAAELSVICEEYAVPASVRADRGWRALEVEGPLDLALTGILARLANPLAEAGIPIFAVSTFDTDYVLIKEHHTNAARRALQAAGLQVAEEAPAMIT